MNPPLSAPEKAGPRLMLVRHQPGQVYPFPVPPGVTITEDNLPGLVGAAVAVLRRPIYVYEDGWNGALHLTDTPDARPQIGRELLLVVSPREAEGGGQ